MFVTIVLQCTKSMDAKIYQHRLVLEKGQQTKSSTWYIKALVKITHVNVVLAILLLPKSTDGDSSVKSF